jgi:hypothetical protein
VGLRIFPAFAGTTRKGGDMRRVWFIPVLASIVLCFGISSAAEFHVTNAAQFQNALTVAQSNGEHDTIYLGAGIYKGNFRYKPPSSEHKDLTIKGEPGTSAEDIVFDGEGDGIVLFLNDGDETGGIAKGVVEGITVMNGIRGMDIWLASYDITIRNCRVMNNAGERNGGGAYIGNQNPTPRTLVFENNLVQGNAVSQDSMGVAQGGGVFLFSYKGNYIVSNNIVVANEVQGSTNPHGGGICVGVHPDDKIYLIGNTIYGNGADHAGGGIFVNSGSVEMYNNIVYGNTAPLGGDISLSNPGSKKGFNNNYSNLEGAWTSSGNNVNIDPLFVDPAHNNFHLQSTSPMRDAGTSAVSSPPGLPETDFQGNPRIVGPAPDIGAYEFVGLNVIPEKGTNGTIIEVTGAEFGTKRGKVWIGTSMLKIIEWKPENIQASLKKTLPAGDYDVKIEPKVGEAIVIPGGFTILEPIIDSVEPPSGSTNDEITITGQFFGTKKGKVTLGGKNCKVKTWRMNESTGQGEILFVVPRGVPAGPSVINVINGVDADSADFIIE